jgi:hypothetical protein
MTHRGRATIGKTVGAKYRTAGDQCIVVKVEDEHKRKKGEHGSKEHSEKNI